MNLEIDPHRKLINKRRLAPLAGLMSLAIGITGCGGGSSTNKSSASKVEVTAPTTVKSKDTTPSSTNKEGSSTTTSVAQNPTGGDVSMKPSMKGFCIDPNPACEMDIVVSPYMNTHNYAVSENSALGMQNPDIPQWPLGTYGGYKGDSVVVKCYITNGAETQDMNGNPVTPDWYQLVVPEQRVTNPTVIKEIDQPGSGISSFEYDNQKAIIGWASIAWFNQTAPAPNVPAC